MFTGYVCFFLPVTVRRKAEIRDEEQKIIYSLLDVGRPMLSSQTVRLRLQARRRRSPPSIRINLLESIDFNGPRSMTIYPLIVKEKLPIKPKPLKNAGVVLGYRKAPMKPGKFDGTGSLESFQQKFEVCARHSGWTTADKVDFLRCGLDKTATQLL